MRTAPVALAYPNDPAGLVEVATQISALTHWDPEAGEACVLQCLAIRHAVLTGDLDLRVGLESLDDSAAALWAERIADAEGRTPQTYRANGWVVEALLGAWSAIACTSLTDDEADGVSHLRRGLDAAVRGGNDTDTVPAIAGALLGAQYGASAVPDEWRVILHGWPGRNADDLIAMALRMDSDYVPPPGVD
jgi:ADP-ribosylglycohydrolase